MDDDDVQAAVSRNLKLAVSNSYACNAILLEVVKDLVQSKKGAGLKYLDSLFEKVSHRLDLFDTEENLQTGQTASTRAAVSTFFAWAKEAAPARKARSPAASRKSKKRSAKPQRKRRR
jgi:hypothetical protein